MKTTTRNILFIIVAITHFDLLSENRMSIGTYTHFKSKPEHNNKPIIINYDYFYSNNEFYGLALFNNSFGQFSQYIYKGHKYDSRFNGIHYELSYGILHGYKGKYQDRIPINTQEGFGIGLIPSIYFSRNEKQSIALSLMGSAGLIFSYSRSF